MECILIHIYFLTQLVHINQRLVSLEVTRQLWIKMNLNFCLLEICWSHLGDIRSYGGRLGVIQDSLGHFWAVGSYQVQAEALTLIQ